MSDSIFIWHLKYFEITFLMYFVIMYATFYGVISSPDVTSYDKSYFVFYL